MTRKLFQVLLLASTSLLPRAIAAEPEPASAALVPTVQFTAAAQTGGEGANRLTLTLVLSQTTNVPVSVPYTLTGTALHGTDYTIDPSPVVIPAGQLTKDFLLFPIDDSLDELNETAIVTLGTPTNATLGALTVHTVTLTDNDPAPTVSFTQTKQRVRENAGGTSALVRLSAVSGRDVIVRFAHTGSAVEGSDFSLSTSPMLIPAGSQQGAIQIGLLDDSVQENSEDIWLELTNVVGGSLVAPKKQRVTILDDDGPSGHWIEPGLEPNVGSLVFPSRRIGGSDSTSQLQLRNASDHPQTFEGIDLAGAQAGDYGIEYSVPPPQILQPDESASVLVHWSPAAIGLRKATAVVRQSPPVFPPTKLPIRGVDYGPTGAEYTINVGELPHTDGQGALWVPDFDVQGSTSLVVAVGDIGGTEEDELYVDVRKGAVFQYALELPSGVYAVDLHFAELEAQAPGARLFDVYIEGNLVLDDLDVSAAAGFRNAWITHHVVNLRDGVLNLRFDGEVGKAILAAMEIRSLAVVTANPSELDFGTLDTGQSLDIPFTLTNSGLHEARADSLSFIVPGYETQAGEDFSVLIDGQRYYGSSQTISHPIDLVLAPGASKDLVATYAPVQHLSNQLWLRFDGNFTGTQLDLIGSGSGGSDWGFLHPVLDTVPALIVDFDNDGLESVLLDGSESHTHESGHTLTRWDWYEGGLLFASTEQHQRDFGVGTTDIELTIGDDNNPQQLATDSKAITVHPLQAVPGILTYYYDATGSGASALLDNVPSQASFAERLSDLLVPPGTTVGGSPYAGNVLVRMLGSFVAAQAAQYEFSVQGGVGHRLYVDGSLYGGGGLALSAGSHSLEVRIAVDSLADLPLAVNVLIDGAPANGFGGGIDHSEVGILPILHSMPSSGNESGGNLIVLQGFGFFPKQQVTVHWGTDTSSPDLRLADFLSYRDDELQFLAPPSPGQHGQPTTIQVVVETPNGSSNTLTYTYTSDGDVPIVFTQLASVQVGNATSAEWGPDRRLYVGLLNGQIKAITFDDAYNAVAVATYPGVSTLSNSDILGITFSPFDATGTIKLYVAHGELYAQGGGAFSGPSPYTGQVSVLSGPAFDTPVPVITRLPVSNHDHSVNGMQFDDNGDLLIAVGGNTNAGVRHPNIGDLPESPLSAAILKAELSRANFSGALRYIETSTGIENDDQVFGELVDLAPGTHVSVQAPGIRNPYDLVYTTWRSLYCTDNGPNVGFGRASTGPSTDEPDPGTTNDEVCLIEYGNYYGHPNRCRGRYDYRQYIYRGETAAPIAGEFVQMIGSAPSSSDGICEYRAATFNGQMRGELIVQKYGQRWRRIKLSADKRRVEQSIQMTNVPALDIVMGPGGVLLPIDYQGGLVKVLVPSDQAATGVTVYDISPWRAPVSGGATFVIGGAHFGTLQNTTVTIGGVACAITSVSANRIVGTVPAGLSPTMKLLDVKVKVGTTQKTLSAAFMALPATPGLAPGFWVSGTPMPDPTGEVAGGIIGRNLYLMGEGATSNVKTYTYDLLNGFWTSSAATRPFPGHHHSAEVWQGKLYLIGGLSNGAEGKVQIFDPSQGTDGLWTSGPALPWNGGSCSTALIGDKIYACGGIVGSSTVANCAVLDLTTNTWTSLAPMPTGVNHAAAATDGQRLYVFGGRQGGNTPQPGFTNVQIYDPLLNTWEDSATSGSTLADMPSGRGGTGRAVYYRGEFYVFGGETNNPSDPEADPGRVFAQVFAYNPATNSWRQDARMPTARHGIWPVLFQGRIHVIGGGVSYGFSNSTIHEIFSRQ